MVSVAYSIDSDRKAAQLMNWIDPNEKYVRRIIDTYNEIGSPSQALEWLWIDKTNREIGEY